MTKIKKAFSPTLAAAGALLWASAGAYAGAPVALTDHQLDHVTAGSAIVFSNADAQATGLNVSATTLSNSILGTNQGVENGFGSEGGVGSSVAVAWGLNPLGNSGGAPPPSSSTSATSGGAAQGNFTLSIGGSGTSSALGQTIQISTTAVYGAFVPGL
ncbi:MAG TPA: hypothetical protein VJ770_21755 [Stellaceae bacterium]|nr:hypothetical protein [Stellaceae bacterium]